MACEETPLRESNSLSASFTIIAVEGWAAILRTTAAPKEGFEKGSLKICRLYVKGSKCTFLRLLNAYLAFSHPSPPPVHRLKAVEAPQRAQLLFFWEASLQGYIKDGDV